MHDLPDAVMDHINVLARIVVTSTSMYVHILIFDIELDEIIMNKAGSKRPKPKHPLPYRDPAFARQVISMRAVSAKGRKIHRLIHTMNHSYYCLN